MLSFKSGMGLVTSRFSFQHDMSCLHSTDWQADKDQLVSNWPTGRGDIAPYCSQVTGLQDINPASQRDPRKTNHSVWPFQETLVPSGSPYNSYQLPLKSKQRLSNRIQIKYKLWVGALPLEPRYQDIVGHVNAAMMQNQPSRINILASDTVNTIYQLNWCSHSSSSHSIYT